MSTAFQFPEWFPTAEPSPPLPPVDDHRIEALVNRFIAGKQEALFTAPDAFYRLSGADAVDGAPAAMQRLKHLKATTLERARDDGERAALGPRLDLHMDDANDGIDRHVAEQRRMHQRQILSERQALIQRAAELEHDNDDKIAGLAEANASTALELARMNGQAEKPLAAAARSTIWRTAIDQRLASGNGPQALALFDRVKDQLAPADRLSLDTPLQTAQYKEAADRWLARETGTDGPPLRERLDADPNLPPEAKHIVRAQADARESAGESARVAKVQALDDEYDSVLRTQTFNPRAYRPGSLARIADAYDAASEPSKAARTRRMAAQDAFIVPFALASPDKQQRMIDEQPECELRDTMIAVQSGQAEAFARDPFAAGTTIYKEVGAPAPIDDVASRIRQARQISQMRGGIRVAPFTVYEIDDMQQALARGTEREKQVVRARIAVVPMDMRPSIEPQDAAPLTASNRSTTTETTPTFRIEAPLLGVPPGKERTPLPSSGKAGSPAGEPPPGSEEYRAAEAAARQLEKPSYDELGRWDRFKIEFDRWLLTKERDRALSRADTQATLSQTFEEWRKDPDKLNGSQKKFLLRHRNVDAEFVDTVGRLAIAQRKLNELPSSDAVRQLFEARSVAEVAELLDQKGGKIATAIGFGSLPDLTTDLVIATVLGPVSGGLVLTGKAGLEGYAKGLVGALSFRGIDIGDPDAVIAALHDTELMKKVRKEARTDSAIDAGIALLAAGVGGIRFGRKPPKPVADEKPPKPIEAKPASKATEAESPRKLAKAAQAAANYKQGKDWEKKLAASLLKEMKFDFAQQVEITTKSGIATRIDFIVRDPDTKEIFLIDAKDVLRLRIKEPNQRLAYPEIERTGAVISRGPSGKLAGHGTFEVGTKIPPTRVQIETPNGSYHLSRPTGGNRLPLERWEEKPGRFRF
jgi:hypothetical protein